MTDGLSDAASVAFDKNGKYLYFFASTDDGPAIAASMGAYKIPVTRSAYVIVLRSELKSPLAPQSDEEKIAAAAGTAKNPADSDECKAEGEGAAGAGSAATESAAAGKEKNEKKDEKK